jgi:hypothetical protein
VRAHALMALAVTVSSLSLAGAQPTIPPNEMAGRERERFLESPVERFMRPGPYVAPEVVSKPPKASKRRLRQSRQHR